MVMMIILTSQIPGTVHSPGVIPNTIGLGDAAACAYFLKGDAKRVCE